MNKLIFTRLRGKTAAILTSGPRVLQFDFEPGEDSQIGNIYIGKVKNIVKNINAAFVEYQPGVNGYYSLSENREPLYTDVRDHGRLREGDEILVQVERAAVKTKDAVLTSNLNITGRYVVLTARNGRLGISSKIHSKAWRDQMKTWWERRGDKGHGLILRTNAFEADQEEIARETELLCHTYEAICANARYRTCFSLLYSPSSFPVRVLQDTYLKNMEEVLTDSREIYEDLSSIIKETPDAQLLRLYDDKQLSLSTLYNLDTALDRALSRQVWLKSGGYLVIEPTEALTVIDVNTGKNAGKKSFPETIVSTNLEAACEIALQLRLRNLSGIIIIDFIDMDSREKQEELLRNLRNFCSQDPVPVTVVDMTPLGLVEVTRKKVKKPLYEQIPSTFSKKSVDTTKI